MALDLHGYTIHGAWQKFNIVIDQCYWNGVKSITVITGRSGPICREFPTWATNHMRVRDFELKQNQGSWKVYINKKKV